MPYDFSSGFSTSTTEVYLFIAVIAFFVFIIIVSQIQRNRSKNKPKKKKNPSSIKPVLKPTRRRRADLVTLSSREQEIIEHLAWFLKDPRRTELLLEDDRLLVRAARQGIREGIVPELSVVRLLNRLDVDTAQLGKGGKTSKSIPTGSEVSISDSEMNLAVGTLLLSGETAMIVKLDSSRHKLDPGKPVEVLCNSPDGMFRFQSSVVARDNKQISLRQSFHVENIQRRKFRRREAERTCEIRVAGVARESITTQTIDISLGGTAVRNIKRRLSIGLPVTFILDPNTKAPLSFSATVVRLSQRDKIAHIRFGKLDEELRQRLFRRILTARKTSG